MNIRGEAEHSWIQASALYLVGAAGSDLLRTPETKRNHNWGSLPTIIDTFEPCIKRKTGITVDNATANTKFMYELGKQLPHFDSDNQHFRCFAHILNLGVQDLLKTLALHCETDTNAQEQQYEDYEDETEEDEENAPNIANSRTSVKKIHSISRKIKRSEILKRKFQSACEAAGVPSNLNPILDCPTRWNSTHDMIGFGLKYKTWWRENVTLLVDIVSFNLLLDKIESMVEQLDEKPNRSEVDKRLILAFQAARDKMLKHYKKSNWIYCTSLILDLRHKAQTFDLTIWGKQIKTESLRKFNELYEEYRSLHSLNKSLESPRNENKVCDEDEDVIDFEKLYECPSTSSGSCLQGLVIDELEEYLRKPRAASSEDILERWRTHETEYPVLSQMARDFLSIPATSVPAERLFSKASLVIRKHRNRLSDESARCFTRAFVRYCSRRKTRDTLMKNQAPLNLPALYFDGRKDKTLKIVKKGTKRYKQVVIEEHVSVIKEPESIYVGYVTPLQGTAKAIEISINALLSAKNISTVDLLAIGCDGTVKFNGVIRLFERRLQRPLQWIICMLHLNELPLRHLFDYLDGKTSGPSTYNGPIGKLLDKCETRAVVEFESIPGQLSTLKPDDLSTDQKYLFEITLAVITGSCADDLANKSPGKCHMPIG
ncbi:Putative AC transposase [Eumeta japonica]|uniref:AC transposase n=1 Tax=Eumeta variegata TaxID=151549 RepID=A0A4C1VTG5_EUMVA|nr:Putative AC transposase [Eumeta japonica]